VTLTVALEEADNRPFEYLGDGDDKQTGFHIELVRQVCAQLGWSVNFSRVPWRRAQIMLTDGDVDAVTYMSQNPEREKIAIFLPDNMLHLMRTVLYVRKGRDEIKYQAPLADMMQRWRFGAAQGYTYNEEIDRLLKAGLPADQTARTQQHLLTMLMNDRMDIAFVAVGGAVDEARKTVPNIDQRIQRIAGVSFEGTPAFIAFTRKNNGEQLAKEFAAGYKKWRTTPAYGKLLTQFKVSEMAPNGFVRR